MEIKITDAQEQLAYMMIRDPKIAAIMALHNITVENIFEELYPKDVWQEIAVELFNEKEVSKK